MTAVKATARFRLATRKDVRGIRACWKTHGEGAVDVRPPSTLRRSIDQGRVIVVTVDDEIIATGSYFQRHHSVEIGGLTVIPAYRGYGLAKLLGVGRMVLILPGNDNLPILAEVYDTSNASLNYLMGLGFKMMDDVPDKLHATAWKANPDRAVIYCIADPAYYQTHCDKFESIVRDGIVSGSSGALRLEISEELLQPLKMLRIAKKPELAMAAFDNRDKIGIGKSIPRWLARHCAQPCITRSAFLSANGLNTGSWGYPADEIDHLATAFYRGIREAAAS